MKTFLIILVCLLAVAFLTNPDSLRHKEKIKSEFTQSASRSDDPIVALLGAGLGDAAVSLALELTFSYQSFGFFSVGSFEFMGEEVTASIGFFGMVIPLVTPSSLNQMDAQ